MATQAGQGSAVQRGTARSTKSRLFWGKVIGGVGLLLLLILATVSYVGYRSGSGDDCGNWKHRCTAEKSEKVLVPKGMKVCFDETFWDNLPQLGFSTYKGNVESAYTCTETQVIAGACSQRMGTAFRFTPKGGERIPKYWFQPEGAACNN